MKRTSVLKKEQKIPEETAWDRVMRILFWFPEMEFSLTELADKAEIAKSTMSRLLYGLRELGLVTIKEGIVYRIRANTDSIQFKREKIGYNLKFLYESGVVEYLEKILQNPRVIILFGSYRWGEDISTSDIDISIETLEEIDTKIIKPEGMERFERLLNHPVQVILFNRKKVDINLFNNIANGIVLSGFLEVKP